MNRIEWSGEFSDQSLIVATSICRLIVGAIALICLGRRR
jgi:hypothetical protein